MLRNIHDNPLYRLPNVDLSRRREQPASPSFSPRAVNLSPFIVRVVLHDADESHYRDLHEKMMEVGFVKEIEASDGSLVELPPAEYFGRSRMSVSEVSDLAKQVAETVIDDFTIFATQIVSWAGYGLEPVDEDA